jgi:hypothetical protein
MDEALAKVMQKAFLNYFGPGSAETAQVNFREAFPSILDKYDIKSVNDAGCGQMWVKEVCNCKYTGFDIVQRNGAVLLDITTETMPKADLIVCRDVLFHLSNAHVKDAIDRFKKSAKYLLATSCYDEPEERPVFENAIINARLDLVPFLGEPLEKIEEPFDKRFLGLWSLQTTKSSIS